MIETDAMHQPFEVDDLDRAGVLGLFDDADLLDRVAQRRKLRLAHQWAVLNPGDPDGDFATAGRGESGPASDCEEPIAGEGSPLVDPRAVTTLGARLRMSVSGAQSLIADSLDLAHRLPRVRARVEALEVPAWKARRVASLTRSLSAAAAGWVDQELAGRLHQVGFVTIGRVVDTAVAVFHPDRIDDDPRTDKDHWRVDLSQPLGMKDNSCLDVTADTLDLVEFHDLVCAVAEALRRDGDEDTLDQRKAKALGLIGRGEHHDLLAKTATNSPEPSDSDPTDTGAGETARTAKAGSAVAEPTGPARRRWKPRRPGSPTKIYIHFNAADLDAEGDQSVRVGHLERVGAVTLDRIRAWAGRPGVRIQPVIHTDATDAVDGHDPPEWMAEVVRLRDPHCVFPGCQRDSRTCDLDHIEPYRPHGPPGQTHPGNLAPLCRRHHNAKTHHGWRNRRLPDGSYLWTGPDGVKYLVTTASAFIVPAS